MFDLIVMLCVQAEIMQLSSDSWPRREAASANLDAWGPLAWKQLVQASSQSPDAEAIARARRLLNKAEEVAELQAVEAILGWKVDGHPLPWIDSWGMDVSCKDYWLNQAYLHPLRPGLQARRFEEYRLATALWVREGQRANDQTRWRGFDPYKTVAKERAAIRKSYMQDPELAELVATLEP